MERINPLKTALAATIVSGALFLSTAWADHPIEPPPSSPTTELPAPKALMDDSDKDLSQAYAVVDAPAVSRHEILSDLSNRLATDRPVGEDSPES